MTKERIAQPCPLCSTTSAYHFVDYGKCKDFDCPECGRFQISLIAEKRLTKTPQQWRNGYAQKARQAPEGKALVIRKPTVAQEPGVAQVALAGKFVLISELAR